jgi:hypothetical protein
MSVRRISSVSPYAATTSAEGVSFTPETPALPLRKSALPSSPVEASGTLPQKFSPGADGSAQNLQLSFASFPANSGARHLVTAGGPEFLNLPKQISAPPSVAAPITTANISTATARPDHRLYRHLSGLPSGAIMYQ